MKREENLGTHEESQGKKGRKGGSLVGIGSAFASTPYRELFSGHQLDFMCEDTVGNLDFAWMRQYGSTFKIKGPCGV